MRGCRLHSAHSGVSSALGDVVMTKLEELQVRNPVLPFPVQMDIEGYTLITFEFEPRVLGSWIPLPLHTREVRGREVAYLSLFMGTVKVRRIGVMPALPVTFHQLNYRAYVRQNGGHALFVFRSIVSNDIVARGLRLFPHLPGQTQPFAYSVDCSSTLVRRVEAIVGNLGDELDVAIAAMPGPPETPGFGDCGEATAFLANVPDAFYPADERTLGRMVSFHPPIKPQGGAITSGRFGWLDRQGLRPIGGFNRPQSIMLQAKAPFPVYL